MATVPTFPNPLNVNIKSAPAFRTSINGPVQTMPTGPWANPNKHQAVSNAALNYNPSRLYHYLPWSAAAGVGSSSYQFFGQAIGGTVTAQDTNMQVAGGIAAGNAFLVTNIYVDFIPGADYVTAGVEATIAGANAVDDFRAVMNVGVFNFNVSTVPQITNGVAPLKSICSPEMVEITGGVGAGVAALQALAPIVRTGGYNTEQTPLLLTSQSSFNATINFPRGAVTLPSANNTSYLGVVLVGYAYRPVG